MASISIGSPPNNSTIPFSFELCGNFDGGTHVRVSHQQTNQVSPVFTAFFAVPTSGTSIWQTNLALAAADGASVDLIAHLYSAASAGALLLSSGTITCSLDAGAIAPAPLCMDAPGGGVPGGGGGSPAARA